MHLIAMDAIRIETLPTTKSLLSSKIQETTDISKEKDDILFLDEVDEDDEIHLRLSDDDEVEVEQDNTSGQTNENQQTNTETKGTDLQEVTTSNNKQLADKSDLSEVESVETIEKDKIFDSNIVDENIDETDSVNEEDSTMSGSNRLPHLMQDSPKYWSNNLDKRWKGHTNQSRNRQNHHHRNSNWYHQQYSEKDRYNNKNHFNHHNNHFKKSKNSTRGSYDNNSRENHKEEAKKEEMNDSSKLKSNLSSSNESDKNHLIKENGFSSDLKSKENSSSVIKDQLSEKTKESEIDSDQKENKFNSCESKTSSDQKCKENGNSISDTMIKESEVNDSNHSDLATKDCDEEIAEKEKENESTNKDEADKIEEDQIEHEDKNENLMQVDEVLDVSNAPKSTSDNDETSGNAQDNDVEENKNIDDSEDAESKNEVESEKSNNTELTEKDASESASTATLKESEAMEEEVNGESSNSFSTPSSEDKGTDKGVESDDLKLSNIDDKNSSATMIVEEIHYEEIENDKEVKESEQSESSKSNIIAQEKTVEAAEKPKVNNIIEEVDLVDDEDMEETSKLNETEKDISKTQVDAADKTSTVTNTLQAVPLNNLEDGKVEEGNEEGRAVVHRRRRRKRTSHQIFSAEFQDSVLDLPIENGVRQKRRSAKNAEEMIRKEILKDDEENGDSSDESEKTVPVNYKKNNVHARPLSPPSLPSLKRTLEEIDCISDSVTLKRIKSSNDTSITMTSKEKKEFVPFSKEVIAGTNELVRKISQEDIRKKIKKFKPEELEAMLVQKILECITIRGEMGKLREQARVSKRNQEAARAKCQQLQKQVEGFDMVLKRITYDKNSNAEKYVTPIKINRSVGLQVNFPNAAKLTGSGASNSPTSAKASTTPSNAMQDNRSLAQSPRKVLKTRSPRRIDAMTPTSINTVSSTSSPNNQPTTLVMSKSVDSNNKRTITLQNSNNIVQILPAGQSQSAVVVNSTVGGAPSSRPTTLTIQRANNVSAKASDLIDLTDEEDKMKTTVITPITTTSLSARFPRVLQAVPASVALSNTTNLRLVQAGGQGSQTAIVNNINNSPRVTYLMQSGVNGSSRQILLTSNNTIRPVTTVSSKNIPTITYKQGVTTLPNGAVRVLTTTAPTPSLQSAKHPAPLPESPLPESNPAWKLAPPAPSLKISKVATGIVLSWNMTLSDKYAEIVSYQLYAYQEVTGTSPSAALWKKVGDVRALPLPMACTLTQFTEGNNYYFAVRAVDVHSRFGQYSRPGNISL